MSEYMTYVMNVKTTGPVYITPLDQIFISMYRHTQKRVESQLRKREDEQKQQRTPASTPKGTPYSLKALREMRQSKTPQASPMTERKSSAQEKETERKRGSPQKGLGESDSPKPQR